MKKYFGLQKVILALTTLTLVGLSSCNDQNFDWDEAHATQQYEKFTNVFIKEFGKPAEGHQWGFDYADFAMGGELSSATRAVAKGDMNVNLQNGGNVPVYVFYSAPGPISKAEHEEVFQWFSNHKVTWTYPTSNYQVGSVTNTRQSTGIAKDISGTSESKHPYSTDCSLYKYEVNPMGDYKFGDIINFSNGWLQHVANDKCCIQYPTDDSNESGTVTEPGQHMDQLKTVLLNSDGNGTYDNHVLDFNSSSGYGYGSTDPRLYGILITDANLNNWIYHNSVVNQWNDKYLIVYLEGWDPEKNEKWSGYYLGFDFGGSKDNGAAKFAADGICNDWILKISNAGSNVFTKSRIMCEDLGGSTITASDIDYNDVVLDVDYNGTGDQSKGVAQVKLTLRAAGGTMPIAVFYDDTPLFEAHEFLQYGILWDDMNHVKEEVLYKTMYNTNSEKQRGEVRPRVLNLGFNTNPQESGYQDGSNWVKDPQKKFNEGFEFQKIRIKVFRRFNTEQGSVGEYIHSGNPPTTESYWVNLDNIDGEAPLKICVPQRYNSHPLYNLPVRWMKERVAINKGYPYFRDWVANPAKIFWEYPAERFNLLNYKYFYFNLSNH